MEDKTLDVKSELTPTSSKKNYKRIIKYHSDIVLIGWSGYDNP